jgi:hypothetical protein
MATPLPYNPTPLRAMYPRPRVEYTNHGFGYFVSADGFNITQVMILSHPALRREERYAAEHKGKIIADGVKIGERLFVSERRAVEEALRLVSRRVEEMHVLVDPLVAKLAVSEDRQRTLEHALATCEVETRAS